MTPYALYRPERGGVQVRREISSKNKDFQAVLRQKQPDAISAMIKWTSSVHQTSIKKCLPSPAPPQPGTSEKSKMAKTEPASPSMITSTEETTLSKPAESAFCNCTRHYLFTIYSCCQEGTSSKYYVCMYSCW